VADDQRRPLQALGDDVLAIVNVLPEPVTPMSRQRISFMQHRPCIAPRFESLERRTLLAYSPAAELIGQTALLADRPDLTGVGQTIATIDTGVNYNHPALGGGFGPGFKVVGGYDFVDNDADPMDTNGHGTMVAGMAVANEFTHNGTTYRGIASGAKLVALRVGSGTSGIPDSRIEDALQWVLDNRQTYNITVVNISLGGGAFDSPNTNGTWGDELQRLIDAGVFVVAASGNDGANVTGVASPSSSSTVFSVGSINGSDVISGFTQRGQLLDLLAPGEGMVSTSLGTGFSGIGGTSFATPVVAGAAALMRQINFGASPGDIASVLKSSSASNYDGDAETGRITNRVYGRLDLVAAADMMTARAQAGPAAIPGTSRTALDTQIDAWGVTHMAYYDEIDTELRYITRNTAGVWSQPVTIDGVGTDTGSHLSLALDQTGKPAIAYFDSTYADLKYADFNGQEWETRRLDRPKATGQFPSLAFDRQNQAMIAYHLKSGANLRFVQFKRDAGGWERSTLDSAGNVGRFPSLAYTVNDDGTDIFAVAYADDTNGNLKYIRYSSAPENVGGGWLTAVVDDLSGVANIDLSLETGQAHIAYRDTLNGDVKFAYRNTDWFTELVADTGSVGISVSLFYDPSGNPAIAYHNRTKDATYLATRGGPGAWTDTRLGTGGYVLSGSTDPRTDEVTLTRLDRPRTGIFAEVLFGD
jgi:subtilisin family serine protease